MNKTSRLASITKDVAADVAAICELLSEFDTRISDLEKAPAADVSLVDLKQDFLELKDQIEKLSPPNQARALVKLVKLAEYFGVDLEEK